MTYLRVCDGGVWLFQCLGSNVPSGGSSDPPKSVRRQCRQRGVAVWGLMSRVGEAVTHLRVCGDNVDGGVWLFQCLGSNVLSGGSSDPPKRVRIQCRRRGVAVSVYGV